MSLFITAKYREHSEKIKYRGLVSIFSVSISISIINISISISIIFDHIEIYYHMLNKKK